MTIFVAFILLCVALIVLLVISGDTDHCKGCGELLTHWDDKRSFCENNQCDLAGQRQ